MIPELLLGQILTRARVDTNDARILGEGFGGCGILTTDRRVGHLACYQIDLLDILVCCECPGQIDDVLGLTPGIRVPAEFQLMAADQAVDTDQE